MSHCFAYQLLVLTSIIIVERIYKFNVSNMSHCFAYQLVILTGIINVERIYKFNVSNMPHCFAYQLVILTSIIIMERIYKFIFSNMSHCFGYQQVILTSIINLGKNIQIHCLQYVILFRILVGNSDQYHKRWKEYTNSMSPICHTVSHMNWQF